MTKLNGAVLTCIVLAARTHYGLGINGFSALALRAEEGYGWVVAFNMRPRDREAFSPDYDRAMSTAARQIARWPDGGAFDICGTRRVD